MKQGRRSRSNGKAAQVLVSLLLVLSMMGTSVFSVSAAGTEDENSQNGSVVYMSEAGDASGEDGSQASVSEEEGDTDGGASISIPENDEHSSTSDEDNSETTPENDQVTPIDEEIPEEEITEEDEDLETLAVGDTCAFAFYCENDATLYFYYGPQPAVGDEYDGKTVTNVYTGFDTASAYSGGSKVPWNAIVSDVTSVVVDESFRTVQPKAMAYWFYNFSNCIKFIGLENIDTSCVTTMDDVFYYCSAVTSLDITSWDTSNVTTMAQMFMHCESITSLKVNGIDVSNVTTMNGMLRYLKVLTEIDLSGWEPSKATTINAFIRDNYELTTIYTDRDWPLEDINANSKNMFFDDSLLVGGNGTAYNASNVEGSMAYIDRADKAGYFTDSRVLDMVNISGTKVWDDANNQDGIRPESVTVRLLANGDETDSATVTAEDDWSFTFSGLPEYDDDLNEISYTITEDAVEGYETEITGDKTNGFVITNSYTPTKKDVSGTITWVDGNNQDGKRPSYVGVQLIAQDAAGGTLDTWEFEIHAPENPTYDNDGNEIWTWTQNDLDHYYNGGNEVKYTVIYTANLADGYTQSNPNDLDTVYSYTPETTSISGSKSWVDGENAEGTRPESITVRLHANGNEQVYEKTVSAEDGWTWTFADVPVYSNGTHIDYTITEDAVENYYPTYDGWNITNTLDLGHTSITVMKDWEDANDQDGKRPESVTVDLLTNGIATGETLTLSDDNNWEDDFHSLAIVDEGGYPITYTIVEEKIEVDGYSTEITGDVTEGFVITNSYTPEKIDITGTKVWEDADDQDGMRPSSIYVHLLVNGESVDDVQVSADENGDWTFAFSDVPKYANGTEITYSVEEVIDSHYKDAYEGVITGDVTEGFTITNSHTPELVNGDGTLTVTKVWDDGDDRDGLRPNGVTVNLLANGETIDSAALGSSAGEAWTVTFTNLPKYADGKEIAYTVTEDSVEGYTATVTGSTAEGFTVTNTHTPATINVNVLKVWDDEDNQDGKRPVSITVNLLADDEQALDRNGNAITAVLNDDDDWEEPFMNLYKYRDGGEEIVYTIEEDTSGFSDIYTSTKTGDMSSGFTITNSYEPELYNGDGTFKVVVVWDDEANNDGIRPTEVNITLVKDNTAVDGATMSLTGEETDEDGNWIGTFTGLPKYENGSEIVYSVKEDYKSGYTYRVELLTDEDGKTYVQLTNVHVSVKEDIEVTKVWDDNNNQDGKRPESITVRLLTNGNLYKTVTLTADSEGVSVSENGNVWKYTMKDIPVDKNGVNIEYTMIEVDVEGYVTPEIEVIRGDEITDNGVTYQPYSFEVTNSHTPEQITVSGTKEWDDADNQDGKRPQFVKLNLLADGEVVETIDVSTDDEESDDESVWDWAFSARDKYKDGKEIEYTITEEEVSGYDTKITGSVEDGFKVTNSYTPETTSISGGKTWIDDDNAQNMRPESITVRLHANGEVVETQEVTANEGWVWEFDNLPVYSDGKHIDYTLTEDAVDDYDTTYTFGDDGSLNVTNTLSPGNTSLTVEKDWEDNDNQDGIRPTEVTVELLRNGSATGQTLTLSDADHWTDTFHDLAENDESGARIFYSVQEEEVNGYDTEITGNETEGFVITNSHTPETVNISGSKVWEDNDDQDGIRPDHITVHLMNGEETLESHTVNSENNWTFTFSGLDKYANGEEISYTIEEAYTAEGYEAAVDGYTITNTHTPEKIDVTGTKTWDDGDNRDGIRPTSITINLLADGEAALDADDNPVSTTVTPDADGNWTYTFTDLDKCADGEEITYSISEDVPDGYHASYNHFDYDMTNTHSPEMFNGDGSLSVIMHWEDEGDQDGLRPKRTTITLMLNDVPDETITLVLSDDNMDENGNWIGTFTGLYKYADGEEIAYNVEEGVMNGYTYTAELLYDEDTGLYYVEITNTHAAVTSDITVTKVWDDNDNQDGIRPEEVVVNLFSNGSAVKSVTLTPGKEGVEVSDDGNEWSYTFENMPVDQNGEPIIYTLDEVDVGSYAHVIETTTEEGQEKDGVEYTKYDFTVTNSHTPVTTEVSVSKIWDDEGDQDGIRPHSITLELLIDGQPALDESGEPITGTMIPDTEDHWVYTFTGIDKYANGKEIEYGVEEFEVEGYEEVSLIGNYKDGYVITNRHTPETTEISGNKVWNDDGNAEGYRPESIQINLYANGLVKESRTITADDDWSWTFTDLPVNSGGKKITYVTTETAIDNYDTTYSGFTLTNTLTPGETSVTVAKDWEDAENQDGLRPESVTVKLLADGVETGETLTLSESNDWEDSFHEVPINDENGKRIVYTVEEEEVEGYTGEISGDASEGFEIINTHTPETVTISGSKTWDDADDQDGLRPDSIAVHLLADGEEILTQDVSPVEASPLQKFISVITFGLISAEDDWSFAFTDLPKYENGKKITYTISEAAVTGYDTTITGSEAEGFEITNTHTPDTMTISGTKVWQDSNDQDGKRPANITINLLADGKTSQSLTVTDTDGAWDWEFNELPKYASGEEIEYAIDEVAVDGYETAIAGDAASGYTIFNSYTPETLTIKGSKTWDDEDNQDGYRPNSVTIRLHQNGEVVATRTVTAYDGWSWTFSNEPKYADGVEIAYTITEDAIDEYSAAIDGYDVTNTYTPGRTSLTVMKDWEDGNDQDGLRPENITVELLADGISTGKTLTLSDENGWEDTFAELVEYENGKRITYKVEEIAVDGYTSKLTGDATEGYVITNTHDPAATAVSGEKIWDDAEDQDGLRPKTITIHLFADGNAVKSTVVHADYAGSWTWLFDDLPVYASGKEITYTITEDEVTGYDSKISGDAADGFTITNTHEPAVVTVSGSKTWDDAEDQDGKRPEEITIRLHANGTVIDTGTVTKDNDWAWEFANLPAYESGVEIAYTITEDALDDYSTTVSGYDVTNSYTPGQTSLTVVKDWEDANDQDGRRTSSITVELLANGEATGQTMTLNGQNGWEGSFTGLDEYENGEKIAYSVAETAVAGYESMVTGDATEGYVITNTYEPEMTEVSGEKIWNDADDQDGLRPHAITVDLYADGAPALDEEGEPVTLTVSPHTDGSWTWTFTDIPKYRDNGKEIVYSFREEGVNGYEAAYSDDGLTITNTHEPETTTISGSKVWEDADDQDGKRPGSIEINLYANGTVCDTAVVTAVDGWAWEFTDLPAYGAGQKITYTTVEKAIDDYDTTYDGYTVTNSYEPGRTSVTVMADWEDAKDQDGLRPDSITVELLADGDATGVTLTLTEDENGIWEGTFEHLDEYRQGERITYTIGAVTVDGYDCVVEGDAETGYTLTFTHTPETVAISASKVWDDDHDRDGLRPENLTIHLTADGESFYQEEISESNAWSFTFADLPRYRDGGTEIEYAVTETAVAGYTAELTGNAADGFTITNTHEPEQISFTAKKIWDDDDNRDGLRPDSLFFSAEGYDGESMAQYDSHYVTADDDWTCTFTVPKYANGGKEIQYTVEENTGWDKDNAYTPDKQGNVNDGFVFTNMHEPAMIADDEHPLTVTIQWEDHEDAYGLRPASITLTLLANGEPVYENGSPVTAVLSDENGWSYSFTGLSLYKYKDGVEIEYSVREETEGEEIKEYSYSAELVFDESTGTYTLAVTDILALKNDVEITKIWDDDNNKEGKRPDSITVYLIPQQENSVVEKQTVTLTKEDATVSNGGNTWTYTAEDVIMFLDGEQIEYELEEAPIENYSPGEPVIEKEEVKIGDEIVYDTYKFTITNTYTAEKENPEPTPEPTPTKGGNGGDSGNGGTVKTSDTNNIGLWLALMIAALAAGTGAVVVKRRR